MISLIVGFIFLITGILLALNPPRSRNGVLGYRTSMSMLNQDTWDESQKYGGISMSFFGILNIIFALWIYIFPMSINADKFQLIFFIITSVLMIYVDELHLKKLFNKDGTRK
ncbi:SdpI family protein [Clostridium sardiniense]|uniref:SdpI family protein n=1 Tax=Clostridium sardiniense TaxID=29369 RepID=A0ABS7L0V6_CLOSR|nr:SdpI family protein [Clostridium sardiniense]MBY0756664.1 SdpI family protein [Clostridium sardiniense]MDQ0458589.1 putative membrane protein [Clostridium sardiniense]